VWYRHSYIWPHPVWWLWWEPIYVVRPPTRYVYYHTPWRTYRRRVYYRPGIVRGARGALGYDYRGRPIPRGTRGVVRRSAVGSDSSRSRRVRVPPSTRRSDTTRVAPSRVRAGPERSTVSGRGSPERTPVARERHEGSVARHAPRETPTRVRSAPPTRSRSSSGGSGSSRGSTRVAPPSRSRSSSGSSGSSRGSTRVAPQRGSSSGARSSGGRSRR
jgi:hypothetical protein